MHAIQLPSCSMLGVGTHTNARRLGGQLGISPVMICAIMPVKRSLTPARATYRPRLLSTEQYLMQTYGALPLYQKREAQDFGA